MSETSGVFLQMSFNTGMSGSKSFQMSSPGESFSENVKSSVSVSSVSSAFSHFSSHVSSSGSHTFIETSSSSINSANS